MGLAGLWAQWRSSTGETVHRFTMLTISADEHLFMRNFHKPQDEKRSLVILQPDRYDDWLQASAREGGEYLHGLAHLTDGSRANISCASSGIGVFMSYSFLFDVCGVSWSFHT